MSNLDNKILFSYNKIIDNKNLNIKKKAKEKAKIISAEINKPACNVVRLIPSNQNSSSKPFLQPIHKAKYAQFKSSQRKMSPYVQESNSSSSSSNTNIVYSQEWLDILKRSVRAQEKYAARLAASKNPSTAEFLNPKVLIVANEYPGTAFPLNGCYNDANLFREFIINTYSNPDITYLTDNPSLHNYDPTADSAASNRWPSYDDSTFPTHDIVLKALNNLCSSPNRLLLLFFAGHGGSADDIPAPIENTLVDIDTNGVIQNTFTVQDLENPKHKSTFYYCNAFGEMTDKSPLYDWEMYTALQKVASSQKMYLFTDCCHSGTIFNLPFVNLGNFVYQYDSSGNIITENVQGQDDYGNLKVDISGNPIMVQNNLYNLLNDISNNVLNLPLNSDDIDSLMTDATTVITYYDKVNNVDISNTKINFLSAKFPSLTNMKGNIIHFSGTRDNKFSFEAGIFDSSGNEVNHGAFTWRFKSLWDLGLENFTLQKTYTCLIGLLNNSNQIPVCSTSKFSLFNNTDFLVDFAPQIEPSIKKNNNKNTNNKNTKEIVTELTTIKKLINNESNLLKYYNSEKIKNVINAKNIFKPKPAPKKISVKIVPKKIKKKLNKTQEKIAKNTFISKLLKSKQ